MTTRGRLLITGAGGGIGRATALAAARDNWEVVATSRGNQEFDDRRITVEMLDVTDDNACEELIAHVRPDAIVNCAGFGSAGAIEDTDINDGREHLEVMTVAPIRLCQLALPHMREAGEGRIINLSSLGGLTSSPLTGWYTASKHALEALTDALRGEVASDNIKVSLIEPGGVTTGILEKAIENTPNSEHSRFADGYKRAHKLTKLTQHFQGNPAHVADVIVKALASPRPKARYIVGIDARLLLLAGRVFPIGLRDRFKRKLLSI